MQENLSTAYSASSQTSATRWVSYARAGVWLLLFGLAYTQPSLYYSNQNQYFLHGLARGGRGFLRDDWLANTADPTPLFSAIVALTYRYLHESVFYVYFIFLVYIYFQALLGVFEHLCDRVTVFMRLSFLAVLVLLHSALLRWTSAQLFGVDYPWYFQAGLANQYVLGAGLQPSVFGVLLLLSVRAFLRDRPFEAVTWSSLTVVMHSTYLLSAVFLTIAYLYLLVRARRVREALFAGLWAVLLVAPMLLYLVRNFAPSSPETFAQAQHLLVHFRIPHHARVDRWLDGIAWAQIGWMAVAIYFVRGSRLSVILSICFGFALVLTLVQIGTDSDTLALLFPWRVSSILVPLATTILLTRIMQRLAARFASASLRWKRIFQATCVALLVLAAAGGTLITHFGLGYRINTEELPLLEHVRVCKRAGEIYLLPVEVPALTAGKKGAASLNFTPPPQRSAQNQNISVDLQQFRLFTGAPIFVDFKSVPYKDVEVLEWQRRLLWNQQLYQRRDWNDEQIQKELKQQRITHVVVAAGRDLRCDAFQLVYADPYYCLYRLRRP